jgi:hypothetical protein
MSEFTQNLLKLTEFPFSYSLIGLIALIAGPGINLDGLSFAKVGPLFILMGFVATTLSIVDPVGAFQRAVIKGRGLSPSIFDLLSEKIFGKNIAFDNDCVFGFPYLVGISNSPQDLAKMGGNLNDLYFMISGELVDLLKKETNKDNFMDIKVGIKLEGLKYEALKTKWITAEIDRNNALIYFIVVIGLFTIAIASLPDFLPKFTVLFDDTDADQKVEFVKIGIVALSGAAMYFLIRRLKRRLFSRDDDRISTDALQDKALIIFRYLAALEAIKVKKEIFKDSLKEVERYLDDNHWVLAKYWVDRIQAEYTALFLEELFAIADTRNQG